MFFGKELVRMEAPALTAVNPVLFTVSRTWAGTVVAWNNMNGAHGRRTDEETAANQWKAGDMIYLVKGMLVILLA